MATAAPAIITGQYNYVPAVDTEQGTSPTKSWHTKPLPTEPSPSQSLPTEPLPTKSRSSKPLPTVPLPTEPPPSKPLLPSHRLPSHCLPSHRLPSHCLPSHRLPSHCLPSHRLPSHFHRATAFQATSTEPSPTMSLTTKSQSTNSLLLLRTDCTSDCSYRMEQLQLTECSPPTC